MDFFDNPEPTVMQCTLEDEEADDPGEPDSAPFVEENPCLVCGHKAFANFIDISYSTSCTSSTITPVKKRLKDILGKLWSTKQDNQTLCLACYDLVDRFDSLESQLTSIRENISEKYMATAYKANGMMPRIVSITSGATVAKKRGRQTRSKKSAKKPKFEVEESDGDADNDDNVFTVEICEGGESDYATGGDAKSMAENVETLQPMQVADPQDASAPLDDPNVYDEHHQLLRPGERIRLGRSNVDESGLERFVCAYCPSIWADMASLHSHVHGVHQPEVVDVAIPAELGLGNTMNCGIEVQNCQEPEGNPKPWSCLFCEQAFRARTNMSSHFKDKHTPYKPFSCADCGDSFRKGIDLNRHKLYFCPQRTVTFAPKRKYKKRESPPKPPPKTPKLALKQDPDSHLVTVVPVS